MTCSVLLYFFNCFHLVRKVGRIPERVEVRVTHDGLVGSVEIRHVKYHRSVHEQVVWYGQIDVVAGQSGNHSRSYIDVS